MGSILDQIDNLLYNPQKLPGSELWASNKEGLILLGACGLAALMAIEMGVFPHLTWEHVAASKASMLNRDGGVVNFTVFILAVLSCRVPALRRQGIGCSTGFFWRLGGCIFLRKRRLTDAEILENEKSAFFADVGNPEGGVNEMLQGRYPYIVDNADALDRESLSQFDNNMHRNRNSIIQKQYAGAPTLPPSPQRRSRQGARSSHASSAQRLSGQQTTFVTPRPISMEAEELRNPSEFVTDMSPNKKFSPASTKPVQESPAYGAVLEDYAATEISRPAKAPPVVPAIQAAETTFTDQIRIKGPDW